MSIAIVLDGREIDITHPREVSASDRKLIAKCLEKDWNDYIDLQVEEMETDGRGVSPLAVQVFESARLVRRLYLPKEKMENDVEETYRVGRFTVKLLASCCPTLSSMHITVVHAGRRFAQISFHVNPYGTPHYDTDRFNERNRLNRAFIDAVLRFKESARTDVERIVIFHNLSHLTFAAYPNYFRRRLQK